MIAFNLTFAFIAAIIALQITTTNTYIRLLWMSINLASGASVRKVVMANQQHRQWVNRLRDECAVYVLCWRPLEWAAVVFLAIAYTYGIQHSWVLSDVHTTIGVIILTPIVVRLCRRAPEFGWLIECHHILRSIALVCEQEVVVRRIDHLTTTEVRTVEQEAELAQLRNTLDVFKTLTEIKDEQRKSGQTAQ